MPDRRFLMRFCVGLVFGLGSCAPETPQLSLFADAPVLLTDLKWLDANADPVAALTQTIPEQLRAEPSSPGQAFDLALGRMAFRSPRLLGGMAAREGLTCQTCHPSGRANKHFFIAGLSDKPGAVDATTSAFSKVLGDGVFNPIAIPSLEGAAASAPYGHDGRAPTLDAFVRAVIEEEFAGARPDPEIFNALITYLLALAPPGSEAPAAQPVTVKRDLDAFVRDASALDQALLQNKAAVSRFIIAGLRHDLGRMAARFIGEEGKPARARFEAWSGDMRRLRDAAAAGNYANARTGLAGLTRDIAKSRLRLEALQSRSLYNPRVLARALGQKRVRAATF